MGTLPTEDLGLSLYLSASKMTLSVFTMNLSAFRVNLLDEIFLCCQDLNCSRQLSLHDTYCYITMYVYIYIYYYVLLYIYIYITIYYY